jgi:hypothetical protein
MKLDRRNVSTIFLVLGLIFLAIGISTDIKTYSGIAIAFILISLIAGGRWMRRRKK